jgi:UDP:flavonoid glycosyltransferase YjiC (YdhE family)
MVAAGVHEGKNEINARIGYFKLGINLKTERPTPVQIRNAVTTLLSDPAYRLNVATLRNELVGYNTLSACEGYIRELLPAAAVPTVQAVAQPAAATV